MKVIDFKAMQKWAKIPKKAQESFVNNVFCAACGVTTIVDYTLKDDQFGIVLKGKCKKCGGPVARLIEGA